MGTTRSKSERAGHAGRDAKGTNERTNERTKGGDGGALLGIHSHRKRRENQKKLSAARFLPPPWESLDFVGFDGAEYVFP